MNPKLFTVMITGATGGLGRELAIQYSQTNSILILLGRDLVELFRLKKACEARGAKVECFTADLSNVEEALRVSNYICLNHDVDIIISNAGITNCTAEGNVEGWTVIENMLSLNLMGAIAVTHPIIRKMQKRKKGQIAYVSSLGAYYGMPLTPAYCASKAGLKAYAEAMRGLLSRDCISVSLITPGFVKTKMSDQFLGVRPSMISAQSAAKRIRRGVDKKRKVITFPLLLSFGMRLLSILPAPLADRILAVLKY